MTQYYQCSLEREPSPGTVMVRTGWIEERGAKKGAQVELLSDDRRLWTVARVYDHHPLPEDQLKEHQRMHRGSLPSVERMV